jgi:hypothetical protein
MKKAYAIETTTRITVYQYIFTDKIPKKYSNLHQLKRDLKGKEVNTLAYLTIFR